MSSPAPRGGGWSGHLIPQPPLPSPSPHAPPFSPLPPLPPPHPVFMPPLLFRDVRRVKRALRRLGVRDVPRALAGVAPAHRRRARVVRREGAPRFGFGGGDLRPNLYSVSRGSGPSRAIRALGAQVRSRFAPRPPPRASSGREFVRVFSHLTPAAMRSIAEARRSHSTPSRGIMASATAAAVAAAQRREAERRRAAEDAATLADLMALVE